MSQNLVRYNQRKYGRNDKTHWETSIPMVNDSRTPAQKAADKRAKAIQSCCAKIRAANPTLTNEQILDKANKWLDRKEREAIEAEDRKKKVALQYDATHMGPITRKEYDRQEFIKNFVGPKSYRFGEELFWE